MENKKFEQLIDLIINEDEEQAKELFHDIVVAKSKEIYESIMEDEIKDAVASIEAIDSMDELENHFGNLYRNFKLIATNQEVIDAKDAKKAELSAPKDGDGNADEIPH